MRKPDKRQNLYNLLENSIRRRQFRPGAKLPSEQEMALQYDVARGTLRMVLDQLEEDGLICRFHGKGTFIPNSPQAENITFVLPCPDNFVTRDHSSVYRRKVLSGVIRAVRDTGSRLETVAVSPTNNPADIDFNSLDHLNQESRVIVSGVWYAPIFEMLYRYSCRVCLLDNQVLYSCPEVQKFTADWLIGDMDMKQAVYDLTLKLYRQGCRRIAIVSPYLEDEEYARTRGYREAIREVGQAPFIFSQGEEGPRMPGQAEAEFLRENRCDGVVLDGSAIFGVGGDCLNHSLGMPVSIRIGMIYFNNEFNFLREPPLSLDFDYEKIGYESVMRLLAKEAEPRSKLYPAVFSGGHEQKNDKIQISNFVKQ